eukprot:scaffold2344_cov149-Skeletonema_menzelii.AAC.5
MHRTFDESELRPIFRLSFDSGSVVQSSVFLHKTTKLSKNLRRLTQDQKIEMRQTPLRIHTGHITGAKYLPYRALGIREKLSLSGQGYRPKTYNTYIPNKTARPRNAVRVLLLAFLFSEVPTYKQYKGLPTYIIQPGTFLPASIAAHCTATRPDSFTLNETRCHTRTL